MRRFVLDASVVMKWLVPEVLSEPAGQYMQGSARLVAPDLILPELGNILWKKVRARQIDAPAGRSLMRKCLDLPVRVVPATWLLGPALDIAVEHDRTLYDSLYLALARALRCQLVTADRRLYNALRRTPMESLLRWVEETP